MRRLLAVIAPVALLALAGWAESPEESTPAARAVRVFKSPSCGCCTKWAEHLEANGFRVELENVDSLAEIKRRYRVPAGLESCHTATVEGYVIEGHVPAEDLKRLLAERPAVLGLAVPGMPLGSPGMEAPTREPYAVISFDKDGRTGIFARHE